MRWWGLTQIGVARTQKVRRLVDENVRMIHFDPFMIDTGADYKIISRVAWQGSGRSQGRSGDQGGHRGRLRHGVGVVKKKNRALLRFGMLWII